MGLHKLQYTESLHCLHLSKCFTCTFNIIQKSLQQKHVTGIRITCRSELYIADEYSIQTFPIPDQSEKIYLNIAPFKVPYSTASKITPLIHCQLSKFTFAMLGPIQLKLNRILLLFQTLFVMNHYATSHDESIFEEPKVFKPERWLRNGTGSNYHPFAMVPFGFGTRSCIGALNNIKFYFHDVADLIR